MLPWVIVSVVRLIIPLLILVFPFWGTLVSIIFADSLDVVYLDLLGVKDFSLYNPMDKLLDLYFYAILAFTLRKNSNQLFRKTAYVLFAWRLVGVMLYELIQARWLLLVFPNAFLAYVLVYLGVKIYLKKDLVTSNKSNFIFLTAVLIPKLIQEYLFHVAQFPLYQTLKPILSFLF